MTDYEPCLHCGETSHYYWNCPHEVARGYAKIRDNVLKQLQSETTANNRTVKCIYRYFKFYSQGEWSTQDIANSVSVSANTARKWLYRLHIAGLIEVRQKFYGRGVYLYLWKRRIGENAND